MAKSDAAVIIWISSVIIFTIAIVGLNMRLETIIELLHK